MDVTDDIVSGLSIFPLGARAGIRSRRTSRFVIFLLDPKPPKDFRRIRYNKLVVHLLEMVPALDVKSLSPRLAEAYKTCQRELLAMDP